MLFLEHGPRAPMPAFFAGRNGSSLFGNALPGDAI